MMITIVLSFRKNQVKVGTLMILIVYMLMLLIMSNFSIILTSCSTINEVSYSQSTISDHEDDQEDVILAKEASFNSKPLT